MMTIEMRDVQDAARLHQHLFDNGVIMKKNGNSLESKPALILDEQHVSVLTEALKSFK
jgi:G:T-mismatch repair DNA endonuclease (very short patch repair protein)